MKSKLNLEIIAEIGSNWNVSGLDQKEKLNRAKELIKAAAANGVDAVKFQLFRADKLVRDKEKQELLKSSELPIEWLQELKKTADAYGIEFLCTPFYLEAVHILKPFVKRWKVASWDITYFPLLKEIQKTGLPVIMSTGASTPDEIEEALVGHLRPNDEDLCEDVTLLHCTGGYPTDYRDMQLVKIAELASEFYPSHVGLSSHCTDPVVVASSVLYNAEIIEVHFDLEDKKGPEAGHSFTPSSLSILVKYAKMLREAQDCDCVMTLVDKAARGMYRRDESDWLRPVKE